MKILGLPISIFIILAITFSSCTPDKPKTKKRAKKEETKKSSKVEKPASIPKTVKSSEMDPEKMKKAKDLIASVDKSKIEAVDAKKSYKKYCTTCHGFKGNMKMNGATDLTKLKSSLERRVAQIYFGKGTMTPFKDVMEDAEIIAVAKYVASLRN